MRKVLVFTALIIALSSCSGNESTDSNANNNDSANKEGLTNPTAIDTMKHPDGVLNGSVISTDTAAMNVQNSINKAKEAKKNK